MLRGDKGTTLVGIKAERNGANGVLVAGESTHRPITGIATTGNGGSGWWWPRRRSRAINGIVSDRRRRRRACG